MTTGRSSSAQQYMMHAILRTLINQCHLDNMHVTLALFRHGGNGGMTPSMLQPHEVQCVVTVVTKG
eukprot:736325-Amphidinium_carterae.1